MELTSSQRREIVSKKTTCPFVGTAMALKKILAYGSVSNPFAFISEGTGSIAAVGNAGGGDLGEGFKIVARARLRTECSASTSQARSALIPRT